MEKYSEKLTKILGASGLSQDGLARRLGVSFVTLNAWVNGKSEPREGAKRNIDLVMMEVFGADSVDVEELTTVKRRAERMRMSARRIVENPELLERLTVNLTYHSNATEGSTMTEKDVAAVILDHKVLRNRTGVEQREAVNHQTALNFLLDELVAHGKDFRFTPELVRAVHLRLMNGLISDAGYYRQAGARIRGGRVALANFIKIPELLEDWCNGQNEETGDVFGLLARGHAEFERIHPFSDGNGRTGRLLLFAEALRLGLVPPILKKERQMAYYKYLEICQVDGRSDPLEMFLAESVLEVGSELEI